jgi:prepilin-type processing-associated H-X9-DG protein
MKPKAFLTAALVASIAAPGCRSIVTARRRARQTACAANLSGIGKGVAMYRMENRDLYPPSLTTLVDRNLIVSKMLQCPAAKGKGRSCDYFYFPLPPGADSRNPSAMLVACDLQGNHSGGRNCLFADMRVAFTPEAEFQTLLGQAENGAFAKALKAIESK